MTRLNKFIHLCLISLNLMVYAGASEVATTAPVVESVLQQGFPSTPDALAATTDALFSEYKNRRNIASLIFYSYGLLRMAHHFDTVNDYVNAAEYAKLGFFYLDEAVDSGESDPRVHYLRARVDAWLPASLGRCVITLADTDSLIKQKKIFDSTLVARIFDMRYRALISCKKNKQADELMARIKAENPHAQSVKFKQDDGSPVWDTREIMQVVMPLVKGE